MLNPVVHVFACGGALGFSLKESGADLPPSRGCRWVYLRCMELSSELVNELPVDAPVLLNAIVSDGYHVTGPPSPPTLPTPHRQSA